MRINRIKIQLWPLLSECQVVLLSHTVLIFIFLVFYQGSLLLICNMEIIIEFTEFVLKIKLYSHTRELPMGHTGKEAICQCWRHKRRRFDLWIRKTPGLGHCNLLQYSCLQNSTSMGSQRHGHDWVPQHTPVGNRSVKEVWREIVENWCSSTMLILNSGLPFFLDHTP